MDALQALIHAEHEAERARREAQEQAAAAVKLQSMCRGKMDRERVNRMRGKSQKKAKKKGALMLPGQKAEEEPVSPGSSKRKGANVFDNPVSYQTRPPADPNSPKREKRKVEKDKRSNAQVQKEMRDELNRMTIVALEERMNPSR